jgi:hypothetical protein
MFKDQNGGVGDLAPTAVAVGLGTSDVGKEFEVAGAIVSRSSEVGGTALLMATEGNVHGSIWTNPAYDPGNHTRGWKRTLNFVNGNVGIGGSKDAVATAPAERLVVAGNIMATGDIRLAGADCAEEFRVVEGGAIEPGSVLVIGDEETLWQCEAAYDTKVAGVVSGAGLLRPGILLGRQTEESGRMPIALSGTVYCKVDAAFGAVGVGDLLTTSSTRGHAMKALDAGRAVGAVIGKALRPLRDGRGLIPILVALQ